MSWVSGKDSPVRMVRNTYEFFFFAIRAWNCPYVRPRWLLDEDNTKQELCLKDSIDNKVVLTNILRKDTKIFQNYA